MGLSSSASLRSLIEKYSVAGPRYTSYPTAPQWTESVSAPVYRETLRSLPAENFSLYAHFPFCEALCYYCGCNIQITKNHDRSTPYLEALCAEIDEISSALGRRVGLSQMAWGGGTPTFLRPAELETVFRAVERAFVFENGAEISIEIDPRVTTSEQLRLLRALGFNRVSLGVQDFDPQVQKAVNRVQSAEMTQAMLSECRELGFTGINFDFIYGLPFQTVESFSRTVAEIVRIRPDRIALYNYAHLPSLRPHQKILEKFPLPSAQNRTDIFMMAYDAFLAAGYRAIGMDHFALASDEIFAALEGGYLYRNFQGYTVKKAGHLIGVGASAIGEAGGGFFQNVREARLYEERVAADGMATFRGLVLSVGDAERKWVIQSLMCKLELVFADFTNEFGHSFSSAFAEELVTLEPLAADGLLELAPDRIKITALGRLFVRNIAMVFDAYLRKPQQATYSQTV